MKPSGLTCAGLLLLVVAASGENGFEPIFVENNEPLLIGAETDGGKVVRPFRGELEEAALWSRALS